MEPRPPKTPPSRTINTIRRGMSGRKGRASVGGAAAVTHEANGAAQSLRVTRWSKKRKASGAGSSVDRRATFWTTIVSSMMKKTSPDE